MTEPIPVCAYGPAPDSGQPEVQEGIAQWTAVGDQVQLWCAVPGETVGAEGADVFHALIGVRKQLEEKGWILLVRGARRDAWHNTPEYPCDLDQAVLYPAFNKPPAPQRVQALDPETEVELLTKTVAEQFMYHHEWAGTTPPGELTWTQATAQAHKDASKTQRGTDDGNTAG